MRFYTVTFREIKVPAIRRLKCRACGKRFTRSRTFTQTVSPFNRNKETGLPNTSLEVRANVRAEANAWQPDDLCGKCSS